MPSAFAHLRAVAKRHVGPDRVPGLVLLAAKGDEVYAEVLGSLTIGGPPVRRDSLFRIASTTKAITAAATMALVDEGLLDLDEPVDRLLPELAGRRVLHRMDGPLDDTVPARRPITPRDLLTFTFGIGMVWEQFSASAPWPVLTAAEDLGLHIIGPPDPDMPLGPNAWMQALGRLPLLAQPGERWMYNTGSLVLGVLLARAAGQPFGEVLRTRLFDPLGMRDTGFWTREEERLATAYEPTPEGLRVWDRPDGKWRRPPAFEDGAAGLVSTVDDLLAFSRMFIRGGSPAVSAESMRLMTSNQLTPEQKARGGMSPDEWEEYSWGFGGAVLPSGAYTWDGGLGTSWLVDPNRDFTVMVLTQRLFDDSGIPAVHLEVRRAAYETIAKT